MSDLEFKTIHKFFKVTTSSTKCTKNTKTDKISLHLYHDSPYKITLPLGFVGYCGTNATISTIVEAA